MDEVEIKGVIVPILTPFNEDESLNLDELAVQIERMISNGINGIFTVGTNGEGFILNGEEKKRILKKTVETVNHRVLVMAGTGCVSTKETIQQSLDAKALGADVLSIITPSFAKATQEDLYQHYKAVAEAVGMPILLYNIPVRTGNNLDPSTVERLLDFENIVGIKDTSGNWDNLKGYLDVAKKRDNFVVLCGDDSLILKSLINGGDGAISGIANVYPKTVVELYDSFIEGNFEKAKYLQDSMMPFLELFKYGNPNTIVKKAVNMLGYPVGKCKAPFNYISDEGYKALVKLLKKN